MAEEQGLDLTQIKGSGPSGRIIKADVQKALEQGVAAEAGPAGAPTPAPPPPPPTPPAPPPQPLAARPPAPTDPAGVV
jgi:pyruvate dehydrogenase E2 component (dihydrolipoamide acetyltransferase)